MTTGLMGDHDLAFAGYSGRDVDFYPAIRSAALRERKSEGGSPEITRFLRVVDVHVDGFRVERDADGRRQRVYVKHRAGAPSTGCGSRRSPPARRSSWGWSTS